MHKILILCFFLHIIMVATVKADADYQFTKISLEQGLSESTVMDIVQDSVGYMWFATPNGLNRYNGYEVELFRPDWDDSLAVCSRNIRSLCVDSENRIWAGGESGVSYYSYETGYFKNYHLFHSEEKNTITDIVIDKQHRIWLSALNGHLYLYDEDADCFKQITIKPAFTGTEKINRLADYQNELLVCTSEGLYRLDKKTFQLFRVFIAERAVQCYNVIYNPNGEIWLATGGKGIYVLDQKFRVIRNYRSEVNHKSSLLSNVVRTLQVDKTGNVWIGTFEGLSVLKPKEHSFDNYQAAEYDNFALSHNSIRAIYVDRDNGIWIGTYFGGVSYYHKDNIKFRTINTHSTYPFRLNDNIVNSMAMDAKGNIWFGTNDNGLDCWNRSSNQITHYSSPPVKSMLSMKDGSLLVGTHWGGLYLYRFDMPGNPRIFKTSEKPFSIPDNRVDALLCDYKDSIWVGTYDGLSLFDVKSGEFRPFEGDEYGNKITSRTILSLLEDSHHRIWIGTFNGLNLWHDDRRLLENLKYSEKDSTTLTANEVTCVFEDSKKRIWVGTCDGLNLFDEVTRTFRRYTVKNSGLRSSFICSILEDEDANLWISTHGGLIRFNPDRDEWLHFFKEDGLPNNQFNHASAYKFSDGTMMFGGLNGVTLFSPQDISYMSNDTVFFTNLWVNDKKVQSGDASGILQKHISQVTGLTLNHNQNIVSVKFSAINFDMNNKVVYQYCLKGLFDKWRNVNGDRITLFDLPVGKYTLCVRTAPTFLHGGREKISQLDIEILPPWWWTLPMILLYAFSSVAILLVIFRVIRERIRMHNELQVEKMKQKQLEEVQTRQMQFFVNISHEFKTPLTLIISPIEKLMDMVRNNEWQSRQLKLVHKNATLLLSLIDQLIHFRKAENGQVKLHVCKGNIISSLSSIYMSFHTFAKGKEITYVFDSPQKEFNMYYDNELLERICFNLLSNAFKFTEVGGKITLRALPKEDYFSISVEDTGRGIPKEQQILVFNRFYCGENGEAVGGTGIGLTYAKLLAERHYGFIELESELGKGSIFTLNLPLSKDVFATDEITDSDPNKELPLMPVSAGIMVEDEKEETAAGASEEKRATLLIVDDNLSMIGFLKENLSVDYAVDIAHDGQEALNMIEERSYDLVLCDVMMPKVNGIIFCRKVKQNIKTCHIPVIMLSAKSDVEHQMEGLDVGADDYIAKPFSMKLLESKIQNILNIRKQLKELYRNSVDVKLDKVAYFSLDQEFLEKASTIIEEHMSDPSFSVETFSEMMAMSRSNLHLKFKAITGGSISDFIRKIRFKKAMDLLESGRYNVAEISVMTGFSTPSYFSKTFKKYYGYLPTEYKKQKFG